ncbi:uncharacterized protein LOC126416273 [Schistocerca serialis cubense]|uniref:uncharacterized protein LOC126416273 n=1 Tax=Schistocerca serialis cubense TaxID=2023355 RepID=UPI00214F299B|nr:uncharacterized protein LOC126416273 [Schistocerca serialis cubense]
MREIQIMLNNIETTEGDSVEDLKCLALALGSDPKMKEYFFHLDGGERIAKFLNSSDWNTLNQVLRVLGNAANSHVGNQVVLTNRKIFRRIYTILSNIQHENFQTLIYAVNLISSLINGNAYGQTLARETGCLSYMNKKFHEVATALSNCCKEQKELDLFKMMWNALCLSLRMVMTNPVNCDNQNEMRHYIKQVTDLMDILLDKITTSYHAIDFLHELVPLIKLMIVGNSPNQLKFSMCNGLQIVLSGLMKLQRLSSSSTSTQELMVKMIELLCASVYDNEFNSHKAGSIGAIPILLSLLHKLEDKTAPLTALIQLLYNSEMNRRRFVKEDGANIISKLSENWENCPELLCTISCLLKYCSHNNFSEVRKPSPQKYPEEMLVGNRTVQCRTSHHSTGHLLHEEESMMQNNVQGHCSSDKLEGIHDNKISKKPTSTLLNVSDCKSPVNSNRTLFRRLLPPFKPGLTFYLFTVMKSTERTADEGTTDMQHKGSILKNRLKEITKKRKIYDGDKSNGDSHSSTLTQNGTSTLNGMSTTKRRKWLDTVSNSYLQMPAGHHSKSIRESWLQKIGSSASCMQMESAKDESKWYRKLLETACVKGNVEHKVPPASRWPYLLVKDLPKDIQYLVAGVNKFGMDFKKIRETYNFENSLTAKDLYELWKTIFIQKEETEPTENEVHMKYMETEL